MEKKVAYGAAHYRNRLRGKHWQSLTTEEEQLADVLRPFGNLVAIGLPDEPLPLPGAARIYASNKEWQKVVASQIAAAPLVVFRAGIGEELMREAEQTIRKVNPNKVIAWIHRLSLKDYETFRDELKARLDLAIPRIERQNLFNFIRDLPNNPFKAAPGIILFLRIGNHILFHFELLSFRLDTMISESR